MFSRNNTKIGLFLTVTLAAVALFSVGNQAQAGAYNASAAHVRPAALPPGNPTNILPTVILPTVEPTIALPTPIPTDCANPFTDITGNVFYGAIHNLYCIHEVSGTDATHFSPAMSATRGQFSKLVVLAFALPPVSPIGQSFTDVPPSYFAYFYIETGLAAGILGGYSNSQCIAAGATPPCYLPNRNINRAELARMVVNAARFPLVTPPTPTFVDVPASYFAYAAIETAYARGVVHGTDATHYAPTPQSKPLTRAVSFTAPMPLTTRLPAASAATRWPRLSTPP